MEQSHNDMDSNQDVIVCSNKSRWLTVVYRDLDEKEAQELVNHKKSSALSWSHAIHDRDHYKALLIMPV